MHNDDVSDEAVAELVRRCQGAATALISGDIHGYLSLFRHGDDYTLMAPYGGAPRRGFDNSDQAVRDLASFFTAGEAEVELVASHASGDLAVLALIERQHGEVGGLPD